jgi:hypothetical protein
MGYTTEFTGHVAIDPPLNQHEVAYLNRFADSRRFARHSGPYQTDTDKYRGPDTIDYNGEAPGQPGLWCNWVASDDGSQIEWNGAEKFYNADDWMRYLIDTFLSPNASLKAELSDRIEGRYYPDAFARFTFDHTVNGDINAAGEDAIDRWRLSVRDNAVERAEVDPAGGDLAVRALVDAGWLGYPDEEITPEDLAAIVALVREADASAVRS